MPLFAYKARNQTGEAINGVMEALNVDAVANQLMSDGMTPIDIDLADKDISNAITVEQFFPKKIHATELIQFSRQMHSLLRAGVPLLSSLTGIANSSKNKIFRNVIEEVVINLESGRDLATCLSLHRHVFNIFYVSMIRIGETTGKLDEIFLQLSRYLERDQKTRLQIKSAIRYPIFVMIAIVIAIVLINMLVIPAFARVFQQFGGELPWATQLIFAVSKFTLDYWPELTLLLGGSVAGLRYYLTTQEGRYRWDELKLTLPLIGSVIYRAILARFARLFAIASRAGIPLITALNVVARALDNTYLEDKVISMQSGIERGDSVTRTAGASGMFDSLVLQMIAIGEESGTMDELLEEVASYYDAEVDYDIERLAASIEPLLTILIGIIVLVLALGVFLPMWDLSTIQLKR